MCTEQELIDPCLELLQHGFGLVLAQRVDDLQRKALAASRLAQSNPARHFFASGTAGMLPNCVQRRDRILRQIKVRCGKVFQEVGLGGGAGDQQDVGRAL